MSANGSFSRKQLRVLGVKDFSHDLYGPQWRALLLNHVVSLSAYHRFLNLKDAHLKDSPNGQVRLRRKDLPITPAHPERRHLRPNGATNAEINEAIMAELGDLIAAQNPIEDDPEMELEQEARAMGLSPMFS